MSNPPVRYGKVIRLRPEKEAEYRELHNAVWPGVESMIQACNMRNFSIFLHEFPDGNKYLFMVYDYVGDDHAADGAKMAADPETQRWWKLTDPCQESLANSNGEWWSTMEEVYRLD
ncbi:MAG TPA: L-rhamnose mutarotase [Fimbriimonas sp.]|nr:L-rhamnose mutarotase [Fimbriimonas sp.]